MNAKALYETVARLNASLRELSQEKLSEPILIKNKMEKKTLPIYNFKDLLWLPIGTLLYADDEYFMKRTTDSWAATYQERPLNTREVFTTLVSLAADDFPIHYIHIPDSNEGA